MDGLLLIHLLFVRIAQRQHNQNGSRIHPGTVFFLIAFFLGALASARHLLSWFVGHLLSSPSLRPSAFSVSRPSLLHPGNPKALGQIEVRLRTAHITGKFLHVHIAREALAINAPHLVEACSRRKSRTLARRRPVHAPALVQVAQQRHGVAEVMQHDASRARAAFRLTTHVSFLHDIEQ